MSGSWAKGSTRRWRTMRRLVLARDRTCQIRLPGVCVGTSVPMHVHHTRGKAHGDDPRFLVAACAPCNLKVGDPMRTPDPACTPVTRWA